MEAQSSMCRSTDIGCCRCIMEARRNVGGALISARASDKAASSVSAAEMNTSKAVALKQIVEENRVRRLFRRLKPLKQDIRSGALANVKIPSRQWFYHEGSDSLFQYDQEAFFSHSRLETVDGESGPFRSQRTRQPLPKTVQIATVEEVDCGLS